MVRGMAGGLRLTIPVQLVLRVLLDDALAERHGLEIAHDAPLPSGGVYPVLARLEQAGWVSSAWEDIDPILEGRRPRRYYRLTAEGAKAAQAALARARPRTSPRWPVPKPRPGGSGA
jgi:PadR family transcriptional regulator, regulatory protein PadR